MRIEVTLREESGHDEKIVLTVSAGGPYRCAGAWVGYPGRVGGMFEATVPLEPAATLDIRLAEAVREQLRGLAEQAFKEIVLAVNAIAHAHPEDLQP